MGRGRPLKYASGSARWSGNLPAEVVRCLRGMPNASEWVSEVLTAALGTRSSDIAIAELKHLDQEIIALKRETLGLEKRKTSLEDSLRAQQAVRNRSMTARQDLLERVILRDGVQYGPRDRNWYSSRVDVLNECGFSDAMEAMEWQDRELRKWREAHR